jgi:acyl-coenzyme A thioesterase PaaI-like protein
MTAQTLPEPSEENLVEMNRLHHQRCFTHIAKSAGGFGMEFHLQPDASVRADWTCPDGYESYEGVLHGGIQATLMDSAMVQVLFARRVVARTGEMKVRFRNSVSPKKPITVTASLELAHPPLFKMRAAVIQDGKVCAECEAKFMSGF